MEETDLGIWVYFISAHLLKKQSLADATSPDMAVDSIFFRGQTTKLLLHLQSSGVACCEFVGEGVEHPLSASGGLLQLIFLLIVRGCTVFHLILSERCAPCTRCKGAEVRLSTFTFLI